MKSIKDKLEVKFSKEGEEIYIECCVCNKYRGKNGLWYEKREEVGELVSHAYCESCYESELRKIKRGDDLK